METIWLNTLNCRPLLLLSKSAQDDFAHITTTPPHDAVVIGLAPEQLTYSTLNRAYRLLAREVPKHELNDHRPQSGRPPVFIATHKAMYFGDSDGALSLGPGPSLHQFGKIRRNPSNFKQTGGFVQALEQASQKEAEVVGKPSLLFFETCLETLQGEGVFRQNWSSVGMVGDDVRNDLGGGAVTLGLRRYLVKTGKYRIGDEDKIEGGPLDGVEESFAMLVDRLLANRMEGNTVG